MSVINEISLYRAVSIKEPLLYMTVTKAPAYYMIHLLIIRHDSVLFLVQASEPNAIKDFAL
jgi:hypothetical protein